MAASGGACFTPRLPNRPDYYKDGMPLKMLRKLILDPIRDMVQGVILVVALTSAWQALSNAWSQSGYTDRALFTLMMTVVHTVTSVTMNGVFSLCDYKGWLEEVRSNSFRPPKLYQTIKNHPRIRSPIPICPTSPTTRLPQYKLDRRPFMAPDAELLKKLAIQSTVGHLITVPLASYLVYPLLIW